MTVGEAKAIARRWVTETRGEASLAEELLSRTMAVAAEIMDRRDTVPPPEMPG